jgi:hypothetical protein
MLAFRAGDGMPLFTELPGATVFSETKGKKDGVRREYTNGGFGRISASGRTRRTESRAAGRRKREVVNGTVGSS